MYIAIFKDHNFSNKDLFLDSMRRVFKTGFEILITRDNIEDDMWILDFAHNDALDYKEIKSISSHKPSKIYDLCRDIEIITRADKVVIFWDNKSKITKFIMKYVKAKDKEIEIIKDNQNYKSEEIPDSFLKLCKER